MHSFVEHTVSVSRLFFPCGVPEFPHKSRIHRETDHRTVISENDTSFAQMIPIIKHKLLIHLNVFSESQSFKTLHLTGPSIVSQT